MPFPCRPGTALARFTAFARLPAAGWGRKRADFLPVCEDWLTVVADKLAGTACRRHLPVRVAGKSCECGLLARLGRQGSLLNARMPGAWNSRHRFDPRRGQ